MIFFCFSISLRFLCLFYVFSLFCMLNKRDKHYLKKRRGTTNLKINLKMHHTQVSFAWIKEAQNKLSKFAWYNEIIFYGRYSVFYRVDCCFSDPRHPRQNFDLRYPRQNFDLRYPRQYLMDTCHLRQNFMDPCYPRYPRENFTHATHEPPAHEPTSPTLN